jgi:hypothetical protein
MSPCLQMEVKVAIATIVSRLHVSMHPDSTTLGCVDDLVRQSRMQLTLKQATPTWLRMEPRVAQADAEVRLTKLVDPLGEAPTTASC